MKAKDIMCKYLCIGNVNSKLTDISKMMKDNNIGFIPIEEDKKIIGVITDRDIVINMIANNDLNGNINSYLNNNIITCEEDDSIDNVLNQMASNKVKRILVKKEKKLVGIISLCDILNSNNYEPKIIQTLKTIYQKDKSRTDNQELEIDEFYL